MKKINSWVFPLAWMALIFFGSSMQLKQGASPFTYADKVVHFFEYGILGVLLFNALEKKSSVTSVTLLITLTTVLTGLYGLSDEIHQYFVPTRECSYFDLIFDVAGGLCCSLMWYHLKKRIPKVDIFS